MTEKNSFDSFDEELLSAYIDGEVTDDERAAVEKRLRGDPQARATVDELREVSQAVRSLPKCELGTDLYETVLSHQPAHPWQDACRDWWTAPLGMGRVGFSSCVVVDHLPASGRPKRSRSGPSAS